MEAPSPQNPPQNPPQVPVAEFIDQGKREARSAERGKFSIDVSRALQFALTERMIPEQFRLVFKADVEKINNGQYASPLSDVILNKYHEKYAQLFDDFCKIEAKKEALARMESGELTNEDAEAILSFFLKEGGQIFSEEEISEFSEKYLN